MKLIFDPQLSKSKPAIITVKEYKPLSMTVISTAVHEVMRLPQQCLSLTSKNIAIGPSA